MPPSILRGVTHYERNGSRVSAPDGETAADVVRAAIEAVNRDPRSALSFVHPEVRFALRGEAPEDRAECDHGHSALVRRLAPLCAAFDEVSAELIELLELAPDSAVATVRHRGRGRASGATCAVHFHHATWLRGGLVVRWEIFSSREAALRVAGFEPASEFSTGAQW